MKSVKKFFNEKAKVKGPAAPAPGVPVGPAPKVKTVKSSAVRKC